ncbi:hypothetical protein MPSEU_000204600 [Mayamaea pseudoterrestris]|nr:hypothetical protein MPSEU_000204600 [Mayamaea pseudoterrestris]
MLPRLSFIVSLSLFCNKQCSRVFSFAFTINNASTCSSQSTTTSTMSMYPELCVFDLDACFWDQEMYEMSEMPSTKVMGDLNGRGKGVLSVMSGRHQISMHMGSLLALQNHADGMYGGMRVAFASSADTPFAVKVGRASLKMLEVLPGLTVWDLVCGRDWEGRDVNQIGRQPPLSSNKAKTHFPFLKEATRIRYDRMLFFDDCNWGDHCGMVQAACREPDTDTGPAVVRTPTGLSVAKWGEGLATYAKQAKQLAMIKHM